MSQWLCIASDYNQIKIALCSTDNVIESHAIDKKFGNQRLLTDIDILLKRHTLELSDMAFIGVNLGPAPYTSLRIAIATVNGLHTATGIPLVGIDALKAFVHGNEPTAPDQATVILLNAFNHDLFYAIAKHGTPIETGYAQSGKLFERLAQELKGLTVRWLGNGVALSLPEIELLNPNILPIQADDYPSQEQLAAYGWSRWQQHETTDLALPLYLKQIT